MPAMEKEGEFIPMHYRPIASHALPRFLSISTQMRSYMSRAFGQSEVQNSSFMWPKQMDLFEREFSYKLVHVTGINGKKI